MNGKELPRFIYSNNYIFLTITLTTIQITNTFVHFLEIKRLVTLVQYFIKRKSNIKITKQNQLSVWYKLQSLIIGLLALFLFTFKLKTSLISC